MAANAASYGSGLVATPEVPRSASGLGQGFVEVTSSKKNLELVDVCAFARTLPVHPVGGPVRIPKDGSRVLERRWCVGNSTTEVDLLGWYTSTVVVD